MAARRWGLFSRYIDTENFKVLLVRKHWTDVNIIWQKYSFGDPLPSLFKPSWFVKQEDYDGPLSLTWAYRFAYSLLKFQPSSLLLRFLYKFCSPGPNSHVFLKHHGGLNWI